MTHYNILNVRLSNMQLDKLKLGIKNDIEVTSKFHRMLLVIVILIKTFVKLLQTVHQLI